MSWKLSLGVMAALVSSRPAWAEAPVPEIFAPGVISGPAQDDAPAFSADGRTVFFGSGNGRMSAILVSHRTAKGWSQPVVAPFSGVWRDQQATMAPDGSFLVFVSNRPVHPGDTARPSGNLWRVDRKGGGWGEPVHLDAAVNSGASIWAPSIAGDGSLYFIRKDSPEAPFRLWRSAFREGRYQTATPISFGDAGVQDVDPAVAPDESFIVFSSTVPGSDKPERLKIAFRKGEGWGAPIDLGDAVNGTGDANGARLGPGARMLYFTSDRVLPTQLPRSRAEAAAAVARSRVWENGSSNIWRVPLDAWLKAAG